MLRLITSLMGRSVGQDTILPAKMINHCETLIPMGAGPPFAGHRLLSVAAAGLRCGLVPCALLRLAFFCACLARCFCAHLSSPYPYVRSRCRWRETSGGPVKRGHPSNPMTSPAKRSAMHYGTDVYAKPTAPDGRRHLPFKWWTRGQPMRVRSHTPYASHHSTRAHGNAGRRHTNDGVRRGCAKHMGTPRVERAR